MDLIKLTLPHKLFYIPHSVIEVPLDIQYSWYVKHRPCKCEDMLHNVRVPYRYPEYRDPHIFALPIREERDKRDKMIHQNHHSFHK